MSDLSVRDVGDPAAAGKGRGGAQATLLALGDDPRPPDEALAAYAAPGAPVLPNYHIDRLGQVSRLVDPARAGRGLGEAVYQGFAQRIDPLAVSVLLQKRPTAGYDGPLLRALAALLGDLRDRYGLDASAVARIVPGAGGPARVRPYVPPPAPQISSGGGLLGATYETELPLGAAPQGEGAEIVLGAAAPAPGPQELWRFLYGETFKPRGGALHFEWSFTIFAVAKGLGAPVGPNPQPVESGGARYNFQPFARDTVYNIGTSYADVRRLIDLLGPGAAIPAGPGRNLLAASYRAALDAGAARGVALSGNQSLNPGWKFHQVARESGLGPALSGNYLTADRRYIVQVFAGDTLFTPAAQQSGCSRLSQIGPESPAYAPIWAETYRVAPAPYDPASPLQREAARLHLGAPLTGAYDTSFGGAPYRVQVFALDTLYVGGDGAVRRMGALPLPDAMAWPPGSRKLAPTPSPPRRLTIDVGPPRRGDPTWPAPPPFSFLAARAGAVEAALGHIVWERIPGSSDRDAVRITNGWEDAYLTVVDVPQLRRFRLAGYGKARFHRRAAAQLQQLFADWEAAGLLGLILSFDGAYTPRTIRSPTPGQTTDVLSDHAYGTAFDINALQNPFKGQPALVGAKGSVRELVPLAYANGFYWGGHFAYGGGGHDGMHFEWAADV